MNQYFEILELKPGATPDEVKSAYRDLAKVWHPDRFREDSPRLKAKAAEKLAEINEAYEKIRTYQARQKARKQEMNGNGTMPGSSTNYTGYRPYTPRPSSGTGQTYSGYSRPTANPSARRRSSSDTFRTSSRPYNRSGHSQPSSRSRTGRTGQSPFRESAKSSYQGAKTTGPSKTLTRTGTHVQYGPSRKRYNYSRERPRRKGNSLAIYLSIVGMLAVIVAATIFFINKENANQPLTLDKWPTRVEPETGAAQENNDAAGLAETAVPEETDSIETTQPQNNVLGSPSPPLDVQKHSGGPVDPGFFTLGSSKADVVRHQGEPEQVRHGVFRYGFSSVFFDDDVVVGWHQSPGTLLKVQLKPRRNYENNYFTLGSTRDQVIAAQGTPDHYGEGGRELRYGESRVTFHRGRVVSWHMNPSSSLSAKLLPGVQSDAESFTLGSSKDVVLSVQGTPDHFSERSFHYGHSMIHFANDRVSGWNEATNYPLSVVLEPSNPTSSKYFTLGSTRDEVIAAQGTPNQYSERMFKYGYSTVSFENGHVVSWHESRASPLNARSDDEN